jgi:hypothetical protein
VADVAHSDRPLDPSVDFLVRSAEEPGVTYERIDRIGIETLCEVVNALARS